MKRELAIALACLAAATAAIAACGQAAPTQEDVIPLQAYVQPAAPQPLSEAEEVPQAAEPQAKPQATAAVYNTGLNSADTESQATNRLIIKDALLKLLVDDPDLAIDRLTQIVGDTSGYIISSRIWYQEWEAKSYKYASFTIGVPVDQFERALRRLRDTAKRVIDETATGEDVTDQYVDLQSQLTNLQATRDRIREFLAQAKTVEEALKVNEQLSQVEQQIEDIQGRMNYLKDRSAFSTITVEIIPDLPSGTPTPTATATSTPTPTAWSPGDTFSHASSTVASAYRAITDLAIWFFVVLVPVTAPFALIGWLGWRFTRRKQAPPPKSDSGGA
jgi:hypothetical protein